MKATDLAVLALLAWAFHKLNQVPEEVPLFAGANNRNPNQGRRSLDINVVAKHPCPRPSCGGAMKMRESDGAKWCTRCQEVFYVSPDAEGECGPEWLRALGGETN